MSYIINGRVMTMIKKSFSFFINKVILISLIFVIPLACTAKANKEQYRKKQEQRHASVSRKASGKRRGLQKLSKDPYSGAIVIDNETGRVLFEDNPDVKSYPASMVKLMTLLLILEAVEDKHLSLDDRITVTAEAARMGGSQVYLKEGEIFTVDDLLYALMIQSANDAAVALALYYKGSKEEFVHLMNIRARTLGMKDTVFNSVHGLPPGKGQQPDISTPRDIARLSQEVLRKSRALKYTSTKVYRIRTDIAKPFIMRTHNSLLDTFDGCDGLKTGYFREAGYSIAATAKKDGKRAIAVIFGSFRQNVRDRYARTLLSESLMEMTANRPDHDIQERQGSVFNMRQIRAIREFN